MHLDHLCCSLTQLSIHPRTGKKLGLLVFVLISLVPFPSCGEFNSVAMASRLLVPVVVVMVMAASLVALLLQAASAEPHIEMVNNKQVVVVSSSSGGNEYCNYKITVRTSGWILGSGTDSTLTFYLYDMLGRGVQVSQDGAAWGWFEHNDDNVLNIDGPCINRPCNLVVTTDGTGSNADWLMSWLEVVVTGGPGTVVEDVTFFNGRRGGDGDGGTWIGPGKSMQLNINNC